MTKIKNKAKAKKVRIDIKCIGDFKYALENEGYDIGRFNGSNAVVFKKSILEMFHITDTLADQIYEYIYNNDITYRADNVEDFIDYMDKISEINEVHEKLWSRISKIDRLHINRIEYERKPCINDDVGHMLESIEFVKNNMCGSLDEEEKKRLDVLERSFDNEYVYTKDIELLKKMIVANGNTVRETYEYDTSNKTIYIDIPERINSSYIKPLKGSVEYHEHIRRNIPRIKRLFRNIDKYMNCIDDKEGKSVFSINQSSALQDSINIAVADFCGREFKAISGSNDVEDYCSAPSDEKAAFTSSKVNRLGRLGTGYKRDFDSEKKILEEIHRLIEVKEIKDKGKLTMYSRWEPCPSCYYVISQFCSIHPDIDLEVKYEKRYGEK